MYGAISFVGLALFAFFKLVAMMLRLAVWVVKSIVKGVVSLVKLARGISRRVSVRSLSKRGINDIVKIGKKDLRTFDSHCRKYGVYYAIPRGQKGKDPLDVLILHHDIPQIKRIKEKMGDVEKEPSESDAPLKVASEEKASVVGKVEDIKQRQATADRLPQNIDKGVFEK